MFYAQTRVFRYYEILPKRFSISIRPCDRHLENGKLLYTLQTSCSLTYSPVRNILEAC
jgi:hypothetical protein